MTNIGGAVDEVLVYLSASDMLICRELNFFGDFIADSCGNIIAISADSDISWNYPVSFLSSVCSCTPVFQGSLLSDLDLGPTNFYSQEQTLKAIP